MTTSTGRLPNLLIVGVPKAGTTSLFEYLSQHHDVCASDEKELGYLNYFNPRRWGSGRPQPPTEAYARHFSHAEGQRFAMEATPSYSYGGQPVIDGVKQVLTDPKIILMLRDPVARLWSAYTFQRSLGNLPGVRSFEQYLDACECRRLEGTDLDRGSRLQGLSIGFYADYVGLWLDAFGDRIRIVFAEHLAHDPRAVLADLFRWLEIDDHHAATVDVLARNVTVHARSPRLATAVYSLKRAGDRMGLLPAGVRESLRRGYLRVNSGEPAERLERQARERVESIYRSSTEQTASMLAEHGYANLPSWLRIGQVRC